ncbi:PREDICTED: putative helicase MOV-10 [Drosophila arizonae]|uniref:Helicase MOV-10 n=1 Tax=Drosophila arizonae TaxID=7263 RepID=A0ABM1PC12_DROAR|nr:PREDICTED: putative helicase MOV-10 [Drosophila arizonae]
MLLAFKAKFSEESLRANDASFGEYLDERKLNYDNIASVLRKLNTIEDIAHMNQYAQLLQRNVIVRHLQHPQEQADKSAKFYKLRFGQLPINPKDVIEAHVDELILISEESLRASPLPTPLFLAQLPHVHEHHGAGNQMCRYFGSIVRVNNTFVIFKSRDIPAKVLKKKWTVVFRSNRVMFRFIYNVLDVLKNCRIYRQYLLPITDVSQPMVTATLAEISPINTEIATNAEQLQAVRHIISGASTLSPYIVFGPPGTGKTTTVVEAILQLYVLNKGRILVTAGSNSACDTIALKMCEYIENHEKFAALPIDEKRDAVLRLFSKLTYLDGRLRSVHPLVLKYSNYSDCHIHRDLKDYRIIVTTLCMAGSLAFRKKGLPFAYVFVDEAAASTEPETLLGIVGIKDTACHVILSGDHKQLSPVVIDKCADTLGLRQSLMERLMLSKPYEVDAEGNYDCTIQTRLRYNYRSHPKIVGLFNKLYYNDELIAMAPPSSVNLAASWSHLSNAQSPILFHAVFGKTSRSPHSMSSYNDQEAKVVAWYIRTMLRRGIGNGVKPQAQDIGVITPYVAQCERLRHFLRQQGHQAVEVCTVHKCQGQEKPIVVGSLVCSNADTTFVANPQLLNVLISRAKSLLILIGNPSTLAKKQDFRYIIEQCKLSGNFLGVHNS